MKRLQKCLAGCLTAAMVCGTVVPPAGAVSNRPASAAEVYAAAGANAFADLNGHWAKDKIGRWVDYGLVSGVAQDRFAPDASLSRAQLFAIMNRLQNNTVKADISAFTDVKPGAWYYDDIAKAVAAGIAGGANGKMRPDDAITRQEVAVVFTKALGIDTSSTAGLDRFTDSGQIADWARGAVSAAVANGFLNGYSNGGFGAANAMTRAEIVAMLDSTFSGYYNSAGTFRGDMSGNVYVSVNGVSLEGVIAGTLFLSPNVTDGVMVNGERVSKTTIAAALPSAGGTTEPVKEEEKKPDKKDDKKEESKPSSSNNPNRRPNVGGGSSSRPETPVVTDSPDRAAIVAQMTNITDGFEVRDIPYEVRMSHPDHFEEKSHPFSSMYCSVGNIPALVSKYYAVDPCTDNPSAASASRAAGKKAGTYYEKEVFMTGKANVYGLHANGVNVPVIKTKGADYTTRLLIHYPTEASEFSGRVYVDILNASSGVDLEDVFRRSYENMIRNGDIYIGITSKSSTAQALKNFNPERYKDLDWCVDNANISKDWTDKENAGTFENGLVWDMISQLGTVLKEQPEKLFDADLAAKIKSEGRSYLMGQSQSHMYLNTYLDVFYPYINKARNGEVIWDGYVGLVGGKATTELSTGVKVTGTPDFTKTNEPYIAMMSGFETAMRLAGPTSGWYYNVPTSPMNRLYEVTSAPHAIPTAAILPNNYEIAAAKPDGTSRDIKGYTGDHVEGDVHLDQFVTAALENIDLWVTEGTPAPDSVVMSGDLDSWGNHKDGLRSPKIEAPVAKYFDAVVGEDLTKRGTEGSMVYFTDEEIKEAYPGGYAAYAAQFKAAADKLLQGKYIIQEDYDAWMEDCRENEAKVFKAADSVKASLMKDVTLEDVTPVGKMETMFNSTAMSISAKYGEAWDKVAPEWAKSFELVEGSDNLLKLQDSMVEEGKTAIVYEEKEIFVDGTASLYALAPENDIRIKESGLPYTNRIIVRTPQNPDDFTGKVWIDNLNATDKFDSEALWRRAGAMIMNNGDAYIGISSKPLTIKTLQIFGEQEGRKEYNELSWKSPNTYIFSKFTRYTTDRNGNITHPTQNLDDHKAGIYRDTEIINTDTGFLWDIIAQTGYAAKNPDNWQMLFNLSNSSGKKINTYLFGQSQSGFNATTYGLFHQLLEEENAETLPYDGIMTMVGTLGSARPLNQSDKNIPKTAGYSVDMGGFYGTVNYFIPKLETPFFFAAGENDMNPALFEKVVKSGDYPNIRYFEMAGVPHSDNNTPSFPTNDILSKAVTGGKSGAESSMNYLAFNADTETYSVKPDGSDINANMFVRGLLTALSEKRMPENQFITTRTTDTANAVGGLQSPQVSVPLNIYQKNGKMTPIADVSYTAETYKTAFMAELNKLAADKWILPIDVQYMTAYAERMAKTMSGNPNADAQIKESQTAEVTLEKKATASGVTYHADEADTTNSHPFASMYCSNGEVDLSEYGYAEEEYFISGKANLYNNLEGDELDELKDTLDVVETNIPYKTRILVRYPQNKAEFNGRVYVDLLNMTAGYDNEDLWRRSYEYLMDGSAYVGLTYHSTGINSLKKWDSERYASLVWPENGLNDKGKMTYKNGITWDVISQLGTLLKSDNAKNILGGNVPEQVFLTGQSSSGFYLNTYLNCIYPYAKDALNNGPIYDGYVTIVGGSMGVPVCNTDNYTVGAITDRGFAETDEPFVAILSEYEASSQPLPGFGYQRTPDSDTFRLYEVAGTPHYDPTSPVLPNAKEITRAGGTPKNFQYEEGIYETDLNLDEIVTGALDNIANWQKKGTAFKMPSGQSAWLIKIERDDFGNTIGGLRHPKIDVPLATYTAKATNATNNGKNDSQTGTMVYLTWGDLVKLYGEGADEKTAQVSDLFANYKEAFADAANALCEAGFIRATERDALIAWSEDQESIFEAAKTAFDGAAPAMELDDAEEPEKTVKDEASDDEKPGTEEEEGEPVVDGDDKSDDENVTEETDADETTNSEGQDSEQTETPEPPEVSEDTETPDSADVT